MWFFHKKGSVRSRMLTSKITGLIMGAVGGFIVVPMVLSEVPLVSVYFQWGACLWGILFGTVIGLAGLLTKCAHFGGFCPIHASKTLRPILRGGLVGAWMNFILAFFLYEIYMDVLIFKPDMMFADWNFFLLLAVKGFIFGAIIDVIATRIGGEGKDIL